MDRNAEASAESTLSNSLESGITVDSSRCDADTKLEECGAGWTNEKHNSYLDYLENSFVTQLYSLLGGETQRLSRAHDVQANSHESTDQYKVLQNGCWQKVSFGKKRAHVEISSESHFKKVSLRSNLANSNGDYTMGTAVKGNVLLDEEIENSDDKAFIRTYPMNSAGHEYRTQSTEEASGQNFREEEEEEEEENGEVSKKCKREANSDDSSLKDQVVPF